MFVSFLSLAGVVGFLVLCGLFAGSETGFISANYYRLKHLEKVSRGAKYILKILEKPSRFLSVVLIGTNLSVVSCSALFTYFLIANRVKNPSLVSTLVLSPLILIFSEVLSKRIARLNPEGFSLRMWRFVDIFSRLLFPLVFIAERFSDFISRRAVGNKEDLRALTKKDFLLLLKEGQRQGILEEDEISAIEDVFDFGEVRVRDIMVPWDKVVALDWQNSQEEVLNKIRRYRFTRYPVIKDSKLQGLFNVFDLFYSGADWHRYIRPIMKVGRSERLDEVFSRMQQRNENMACVVKGNKIIGIITLEDLMREIISNFL